MCEIWGRKNLQKKNKKKEIKSKKGEILQSPKICFFPHKAAIKWKFHTVPILTNNKRIGQIITLVS